MAVSELIRLPGTGNIVRKVSVESGEGNWAYWQDKDSLTVRLTDEPPPMYKLTAPSDLAGWHFLFEGDDFIIVYGPAAPLCDADKADLGRYLIDGETLR